MCKLCNLFPKLCNSFSYQVIHLYKINQKAFILNNN